MAKKKKIRILELSDTVFSIYRNSVKGNENITYETACKKFTRNMHLGEEEYDPYNEDGDTKLFSYGYMTFKVKNNRVIWLKTRGRYPKGWMKDWNRHKELSTLLGIE